MEKKEQYSVEFRQEAVKWVTEQGLSLSEASRRLGIPKGTLGHWVAMSRLLGISRSGFYAWQSRTPQTEPRG